MGAERDGRSIATNEEQPGMGEAAEAPVVRRSSLVDRKAIRRWLRILGWATAGVMLLTVTVRVARAAPQPTVRLSAPLVGEKARMGEAEVGNLIADALRAATGADIALVAGGEIKDASLPPGEVTADQVVDLLTYGQDAVVVLSLNGATLRRALEQGVSQYPRKNKGFLQVSGIEFKFTPGGGVTARTAGGASLQDGKTYRVAMSSSLASGAYGYFRLWSRTPDASPPPGGGLTLARALQDYLGRNRQIDLRVEGRIVAQGQ
jgi:5'-nucleotidase/UDP-sugar diphosphatase